MSTCFGAKSAHSPSNAVGTKYPLNSRAKPLNSVFKRYYYPAMMGNMNVRANSNPGNMPIPRFTMRQMLSSIVWISVGMSLVAFSLRPYGLPVRPTMDPLAGVRIVAFVSAGALIGNGIGRLTSNQFFWVAIGPVVSFFVFLAVKHFT